MLVVLVSGCPCSDCLCKPKGHVQAALGHCYTVETQQDRSGERLHYYSFEQYPYKKQLQHNQVWC